MSALAIVFGYAALIYVAGWWGVAAMFAHVVVMLIVLPRKRQK